MHTQVDINCKMRAILIDWIVEVHLKFKLADPTLYLTCHIIDRFCMQENVHRSKLQLVGVTALLIACKYEEIFPTEVRVCVCGMGWDGEGRGSSGLMLVGMGTCA